MRPGSLVAAACLALLSVLRVTEQSYGPAVLFAVLALAALAFGARPPRASGAPPEPPAADTVRAAATVHERNHRTWRLIALAGLGISVVGALTFPPMALVMAALTGYSVHRMRQSRRSSRLLEGMVG